MSFVEFRVFMTFVYTKSPSILSHWNQLNLLELFTFGLQQQRFFQRLFHYTISVEFFISVRCNFSKVIVLFMFFETSKVIQRAVFGVVLTSAIKLIRGFCRTIEDVQVRDKKVTITTTGHLFEMECVWDYSRTVAILINHYRGMSLQSAMNFIEQLFAARPGHHDLISPAEHLFFSRIRK